MSLSRKRLEGMIETELYPRLKTLFERMGKRNIRITHGSSEAGRDLVYDEHDDQGQAVHVAVVVKRGLIKGHASGRGTAGEIFFQVQNCFGGPSIQVETLDNQQVDKVIVVTGGRYNEPALQSLQRSCKDCWPGQVFFWDGDRLWELLRQYLGPSTLFASIEESLALSADFSESYELILNGHQRPTYGYVESGPTRLFIAAKSDKADPMPIKLTFQVKDPSVIERALKHGGSFHFQPGEASVEYPEPLASLTGGSLLEMRVTPYGEAPPPPTPRNHDAMVIFQAGDHSLILEDLFTFTVEDGILHMHNNGGDVPQKVVFRCPYPVMNSAITAESGLKATFENLSLAGVPCDEALTSARLISILNKPGALIHLHLKEGNAHLVTFHTATPLCDLGNLDVALEVLGQLQAIQGWLNVAIQIPRQGISFAEADQTRFVHAAIFNGAATLQHDAAFTLSFDPNQYTGESIPVDLHIPYSQAHKASLFGHEINLGPSSLDLRQTNFVKSDIKSSEESLVLESQQPKGTATFRFDRVLDEEQSEE